jgi:hypothetical protein
MVWGAPMSQSIEDRKDLQLLPGRSLVVARILLRTFREGTLPSGHQIS